MLSKPGLLSTLGKFQQPLNSPANSGHEALIQEGAENKVCKAKTKIQPVTRKGRKTED